MTDSHYCRSWAPPPVFCLCYHPHGLSGKGVPWIWLSYERSGQLAILPFFFAPANCCHRKIWKGKKKRTAFDVFRVSERRWIQCICWKSRRVKNLTSTSKQKYCRSAYLDGPAGTSIQYVPVVLAGDPVGWWDRWGGGKGVNTVLYIKCRLSTSERQGGNNKRTKENQVQGSGMEAKTGPSWRDSGTEQPGIK